MVTALIVDDEQDFADILAERLRHRGVQAHAVYSGEAAVEDVRASHPEVIVLDVNMPGLNGLDTLQRIRSMSPSTEIILLTADSTVATAVAGMKLGAGDYLLKPADIDTVLESIGEAEARRMERLSRQRMAETAKLAALGELAKGVAHEINNPVQIMLNEAGWIKELLDEQELRANALSPDVREAISRIEEHARRCKAITAKLLTLRCSVDTRVPTTDLRRLVAALLQERHDRLQALGIQPVIDLPEDLPMLRALQSEWEQVLGNLIDNALDALESKSSIAGSQNVGVNVGVMDTTQARLRISAEVQRADITVLITDTGCGIEAHLLTRIFEPFFSTKEVGKGIGLGLAISHGIVEAMAGEISVRSTPGAGSTFTVRVPLEAPARPEHNDKHQTSRC